MWSNASWSETACDQVRSVTGFRNVPRIVAALKRRPRTILWNCSPVPCVASVFYNERP